MASGTFCLVWLKSSESLRCRTVPGKEAAKLCCVVWGLGGRKYGHVGRCDMYRASFLNAIGKNNRLVDWWQTVHVMLFNGETCGHVILVTRSSVFARNIFSTGMVALA